jgi:hypothetical protein
MKIVKEHNEVRHLVELCHYEAHDERKESSEFRRVKKEIKSENPKCFIDNGYCDGEIEIHHSIIEFSAQNGVDWEKVERDFPNVDHIDDKQQMLCLCRKHHRDKYFGIHELSYPVFLLQRYMNKEALEDFENAVKEQIKKDNGV